jgi:hypothetical protein
MARIVKREGFEARATRVHYQSDGGEGYVGLSASEPAYFGAGQTMQYCPVVASIIWLPGKRPVVSARPRASVPPRVYRAPE